MHWLWGHTHFTYAGVWYSQHPVFEPRGTWVTQSLPIGKNLKLSARHRAPNAIRTIARSAIEANRNVGCSTEDHSVKVSKYTKIKTTNNCNITHTNNNKKVPIAVPARLEDECDVCQRIISPVRKSYPDHKRDLGFWVTILNGKFKNK